MKILFATDGSDASNKALAAFVARRSWFREAPRITLVTVHAAVPYKGAAAKAGKGNLARYYDEECEAALVPARALLTAAKVEFDELKRVGDPASEIVLCAQEIGADLIAMGTHGHTSLASLVLGSVAAEVLAHSKTPVLSLH
jgi:nucleotide-binding universal stress UspA family protein